MGNSNGVLNVSAVEKSTGKDHKIEIKNDKGRLSDEEIQRMVEEAEKYAAEDEANKVRIEARNSLENYLYSMKSAIADEKLASKMSGDDKETVNSKIAESMTWLSSNQLAEKEELEGKQKEVSDLVTPILQKVSGGAYPQEASSAAPPSADEGPGVEEID